MTTSVHSTLEVIMPELVLVRNLAKGPTVFTDSATKDEFTWEGAGDNAGRDLQHVPEGIVKHPSFRRCIDRGVFAIANEDGDYERARLQHTDWNQAQEEASLDAREVLDQVQDNDLVQMICAGPGNRPGSTCGTPIPVQSTNLNDHPPLCAQHESLAAEYVQHIGESGEVIWSRATVGDPLPSQV